MNGRELALRVLLEVEQGQKSHLALADGAAAHPELPERELRLARKLVRGTLEEQLLLDWRLEQKSSVPVAKMKPLVRNLLRMSAYQIFFLDKIPDAAVVSEAVKLMKQSRLRGLSGFVNGVLRAVVREQDWAEEPEEIRAGIPAWILEKWKREQGEEACRSIVQALKQEEPVTFRLVKGDLPEEELLESLREDGMEAVPAPFPEGAYRLKHVKDLTGSRAFREGYLRIQDASSMLAGVLAAPGPGELVLDVCAAPGGKSIHIAELLKGTGTVIACDLTEQKRKKICENIGRTGLKNIEARVQDARQFVPEWEEAFDLVLADLPCSGLGVMGRKPEIRFLVTPEEIAGLQRLQREILANVVRYVKPGGCLFYSTCTVTAEENGQNRAWIMERLGLRPQGFRDLLPPALSGEGSAEEGWLQLLPGVHPCDGFYMAKFRKMPE